MPNLFRNLYLFFFVFFRLFWSSGVHCYPASPGEDNLWLLADGLGARVAFDCQPLLYWQSGMSPFLASNHRRNAFLGNQQKRRPNEADPSWRSRHFGQKGHQAQSWVGKPPLLLLLPLDTKMRFEKDFQQSGLGNLLIISCFEEDQRQICKVDSCNKTIDYFQIVT